MTGQTVAWNVNWSVHVLQLYCTREGAICDPQFLIRRLAQLPQGAEFCDGGQHDSQEVLRLLLDSLHNDLVPLIPISRLHPLSNSSSVLLHMLHKLILHQTLGGRRSLGGVCTWCLELQQGDQLCIITTDVPSSYARSNQIPPAAPPSDLLLQIR